MKLHDLIKPGRVVLDMKPGDKETVFRQLLAPLIDASLIEDSPALLAELLDRERLMTTAIKKGIAIPHTFTRQVSEPMVVIGRCTEGSDFDSFDGSPTFCYFFLIEPATGQSVHLQLLSQISYIVEDKDFLRNFLAAGSVPELLELL